MRAIKYSKILVIITLILLGCESIQQPKPKGLLRLQYPQPQYSAIPNAYPFDFEYNNWVQLKGIDKKAPDLYYPKMKATLYLTYVAVENNIDSLLNDAYQLPGKHMIKAEEIPERIFMAPEERVFGTLFTVVGNAASQLQFFLTDSTDHFLMGSLYFYSRPNYDSIMPAAKYLERDVMHLMESLRWKY
jgi:gliding motility-associated lipoprotein GldD